MTTPGHLILIAGPSGSGKSRLARAAGLPELRLDDFYHDADHPGLPTREYGGETIVDWDDAGSWDCDAAVRAIGELLTRGSVEVSSYDISVSRAVGTHRVSTGSGRVVIAEGLFSPELVAPCRAAGIEVTAIWLDRRTASNYLRRLWRDVRQHRKPLLVLLRRGAALARAERQMRDRVLGRGFEPMSMAQACAVIGRLADTRAERPFLRRGRSGD